MKLTLASRITLLRILMIPVFVACYCCLSGLAQSIVPAAIFILASLTDFLDGYLARSRNEVTNFGKFMDPIADKLLVLSAFVLLVRDERMNAIACIIVMSREFMISGFRLIASERGLVLAASKLGKIKTTVQIIAIVLLLLDNFPFCYLNFPMHILMEWLSVFFTVWSGADYLIRNRSALEENS